MNVHKTAGLLDVEYSLDVEQPVTVKGQGTPDKISLTLSSDRKRGTVSSGYLLTYLLT